MSSLVLSSTLLFAIFAACIVPIAAAITIPAWLKWGSALGKYCGSAIGSALKWMGMFELGDMVQSWLGQGAEEGEASVMWLIVIAILVLFLLGCFCLLIAGLVCTCLCCCGFTTICGGCACASCACCTGTCCAGTGIIAYVTHYFRTKTQKEKAKRQELELQAVKTNNEIAKLKSKRRHAQAE